MIFLKIIWFFLPAYAANIAASIFKRFLDLPISEKIFGSHKTLGGFCRGILAAFLIAFLQRLLFSFKFFQEISFFDYSKNFLSIGFLLGFGALFGDLIKSFFKRRIGIPPGQKWIPFDQIDYTSGALIFISLLWRPSVRFVFLALILNFFLHIFVNHLGFLIGIRKSKW
ncbi:MAG: CDP-archaeol synthase [Patescibacteria group bacterium]|nr:CDP-archaeol synthase [Patescibacteria group bacterium]